MRGRRLLWRTIAGAIAVALLCGPIAATPAQAANCKVKTFRYQVRITHSERRITNYSTSNYANGDVIARLGRTLVFADVPLVSRRCKNGYRDIFVETNGVDQTPAGTTATSQINNYFGWDERVSNYPSDPPQRRQVCPWDFQVQIPDHDLRIGGNIRSTRKDWNFDVRTQAGVDHPEYYQEIDDKIRAACPDLDSERNASTVYDTAYENSSTVTLARQLQIGAAIPRFYAGYEITRGVFDESKPPEELKKLHNGESATVSANWSFTLSGTTSDVSVTFDFDRIEG